MHHMRKYWDSLVLLIQISESDIQSELLGIIIIIAQQSWNNIGILWLIQIPSLNFILLMRHVDGS